MRLQVYFIYLLLITSCIGQDVVPDYVQPKIVISNPILNLKIGETHMLHATYLDSTGQPATAEIIWSSSDELIMTVSENGTIEGISEGFATITATNVDIHSSITIQVSMEETSNDNERTAEIVSTSSYKLSGTAVLIIEEGNNRLDFLGNFEATSALPGLYVYLTNNPNTISGALEIGPVEDFEGAQSYPVPDEVELFTYNYVLFYCKPFVVKVGEGELD